MSKFSLNVLNTFNSRFGDIQLYYGFVLLLTMFLPRLSNSSLLLYNPLSSVIDFCSIGLEPSYYNTKLSPLPFSFNYNFLSEPIFDPNPIFRLLLEFIAIGIWRVDSRRIQFHTFFFFLFNLVSDFVYLRKFIYL